MDISNRISEVSEHFRLSLKDLSARTGIGRGALHSYIKSDVESRSKITYDNLINIVKAFPEVNRDWLVFGEGEMLEKKPAKEIDQPKENFLDKYIKAMEDSVSAIKELSQARKELAESRGELIDCLKGHLNNPSGVPVVKRKG